MTFARMATYNPYLPSAAANTRASAPPAPPASVPAANALIGVIERLEHVVDQETADLRANRPVDLAETNGRKSHGLLELMRGMRGIDPAALDRPLADRLRALRTKLDRNQATLRMHMDAVQEIASMLTGAMRDAESDGTYSAGIRFGRR